MANPRFLDQLVLKWDLRGSCPSCVLAQQIKEEEEEKKNINSGYIPC